MTHRKTLGFKIDAAETAALTMVDPYATRRIFAACDWEHDRPKIEKAEIRRINRLAKRKERALDKVSKELGEEYATVLKAVLERKEWTETGLEKRAFYDMVKKLQIFF